MCPLYDRICLCGLELRDQIESYDMTDPVECPVCHAQTMARIPYYTTGFTVKGHSYANNYSDVGGH